MISITKDSSRQYHLLVKGLLSGLDIPGQFHNLIADLSLARGSRVRRVSYLDHMIIPRNGDTELFLQLSFGEEECGFEDVARSFCGAVIHPDSDTALLKISRYGLLGFSPIEGPDFSECWNMIILKTVYLDGPEVFEGPQRQAITLAADIVPEWFRIVTFVAGSSLEEYFGINPVFCDIGTEATRPARAQSSQLPNTGWSWTQSENLGHKLLKKWSSNNSAEQSTAQINENALEVITLLFDSVKDVSRLLKLAYDDEQLTYQRHRQIFKCLYDLTRRACNAFTSNEEIMLTYKKYIASHAISASIKAVGVGCRGLETYRYFAERALVKPEGWLTRVGRVAGVVGGATPEMVRKGHLVKGAFSSINTIWNIWGMASDIYKIVESKERRDSCAAAAHLISQTWFTAAETITFLRWIHCTNGQFRFVDHCGERWEETLKFKLGEIEEDWKSPEAVRLYLKSQHDTLTERSEELRIKFTKAYSNSL